MVLRNSRMVESSSVVMPSNGWAASGLPKVAGQALQAQARSRQSLDHQVMQVLGNAVPVPERHHLFTEFVGSQELQT